MTSAPATKAGEQTILRDVAERVRKVADAPVMSEPR